MQRRDFIKTSGKITAASVLLNGIPAKGIARHLHLPARIYKTGYW
jgi:hypothetical protein